MQQDFHIEATKWRDLDPGDLFYCSLGNEIHLCLKLRGEVEDGDDYSIAGLLTTSPPDYVKEVTVQNLTHYRLLDARIAPSSKSYEISSDEQVKPLPGMLICTREGIFLVFAEDHGYFAANVRDGTILRSIPSPCAVIDEWKIIVPGPDEHLTVFEWSSEIPS